MRAFFSLENNFYYNDYDDGDDDYEDLIYENLCMRTMATPCSELVG